MKKIYCVVSGFPDSYSDLGKISLIFIRNLIELKSAEWEINVICNNDENLIGYLKDPLVKSYIVTEVTVQPDIWIQIGEPHTYANYGKIINIGVCLTPPTDVVSKITIDGINRMDVLLVNSKYAKDVMEATKIEHREGQNGRIVATDKVMRPIEVINFGVNEELYSFNEPVPTFAHILETFCFVCVADWDQFDTDNAAIAIFNFIRTFKGRSKKPALIIKTATEVPSYIDRDTITKRIQEIRKAVGDIETQPSIFVLNDIVSDTDMRKLYETQRVKAMFTLSRSIRSGLDLQEFSLTGKPIIAPLEGAHKAYLNPESTVFIPGSFIQTNKAQHNELIVPNSAQYVIDFYNFQEKLKHMYEEYNTYKHAKNKLISKSITSEVISAVLDKYIRPINNVQYTPEEETFEL